jgi:hypothetical protein
MIQSAAALEETIFRSTLLSIGMIMLRRTLLAMYLLPNHRTTLNGHFLCP